MERKVIELISMIFRMLIRNWAKDNTVLSQNLIDFGQMAQACGLQMWDSMQFNYTMQSYIADIAKHFFEDIEIESNERKEEIVNEIIKDVEKVNISEETVALEFFKPDVLKTEILKNGQEMVKLWSDKERGLYENCVSYVAKACVEFVLKWPGFTPKALTVVIERQMEYQKYLQKILSEIHNMKNLYKSTEVTYRDFENKYRETILERYGKVELIGAGINNRKIKKYNITSAYVELNCLDYEDEIEISQVLKDSNVVWIRGEAGSGKTTFLKWVAICSAGNDYKKVENIRGTLPIVIEVRRIQEWPVNLQVYVNRFAESFGYHCPEGWLDHVLKENKVLILIDGLDEVSENRRDDVYDFVEELVKKYGSAYLRIMWIRILNILLHHYDRRGRNAVEIEKLLQSYNLPDQIQSIQEIRQKIVEMVMECVSTESVTDANARSKIQMAVGYIQEHFGENLTVNDLAEHYGMSPNYFSSMFKKEMSRSAVNYITELRINQARELLYHSELSVVDISKKVGYEDSQYFFRVFKKYLGMTPLQYREESRK